MNSRNPSLATRNLSTQGSGGAQYNPRLFFLRDYHSVKHLEVRLVELTGTMDQEEEMDRTVTSHQMMRRARVKGNLKGRRARARGYPRYYPGVD